MDTKANLGPCGGAGLLICDSWNRPPGLSLCGTGLPTCASPELTDFSGARLALIASAEAHLGGVASAFNPAPPVAPLTCASPELTDFCGIASGRADYYFASGDQVNRARDRSARRHRIRVLR